MKSKKHLDPCSFVRLSMVCWSVFKYCKISNISPGRIDILSTFIALIFGRLICGGHFVLVSVYQDFKNYYYTNMVEIFQAKKIFSMAIGY